MDFRANLLGFDKFSSKYLPSKSKTGAEVEVGIKV